MEIDPLEAVIVWLQDKLTGVGGRVAGKHRYGEGWGEEHTGVSVHLDGGLPDIYAPVATPRLEIRIFADDQVKIVNVWRELIALCRDNRRFVVNTSLGAALIHHVLPETNLSMLYDEQLRKDLGVVFVSCKVGEAAVSN